MSSSSTSNIGACHDRMAGCGWGRRYVEVVVEVLLCAQPSFARRHHERVIKRVDESVGCFRSQSGMGDSYTTWNGRVR